MGQDRAKLAGGGCLGLYHELDRRVKTEIPHQMSAENQSEMAETTGFPSQQTSRIFYGWWVVFAAAVGIALHIGPVVVGTFGVFLKPLNQEFGWSRGQISFAFSLFAIAGAISAPVVGRLVDYGGARRVVLPATFLFGLGVVGLALLSGHLLLLYAIYLYIGIVGSGTTPIPYAKVITRWFDRRRGLALGLTVAASSLSLAAMPSLAQVLIVVVGWRHAYMIIALMVLGAIPVVALLLRESPQTMGLRPDGATTGQTCDARPHDGDEDVAFSQAWRSNTFWLIAVPFFLMSLSFHGCILHLVPLLTDRGLSPSDAATAASLVGAGGLVARLGSGFLLDLFFAPSVAVSLFLSSTVGLILLWSGASGSVPFAAGCKTDETVHRRCRNAHARKGARRDHGRGRGMARRPRDRDGPADAVPPAHVGVSLDPGKRRARSAGRPRGLLRAHRARKPVALRPRRRGSGRHARPYPRRADRGRLPIPIVAGRLALGTWQGVYLFSIAAQGAAARSPCT